MRHHLVGTRLFWAAKFLEQSGYLGLHAPWLADVEFFGVQAAYGLDAGPLQWAAENPGPGPLMLDYVTKM